MSPTSTTFWDHLNELKIVIIKTMLVWLFATCIAFGYNNQLVDIITKPIRDKGLVLHFLSPTDSFFYVIKICSLAGLVVSLPILTIFLWQYLRPALEHHEKNFILKYIISIFLFTSFAIVFGFNFLIPSTLHFLLDFAPKNTELLLTANEYMNFLFGLLILMVLVFQTPIIVFGLIRSGLVEKKFFTSKRKEIYFAILVFMAAFGSPDVLSWGLSTLPVIILYEAAILLASKKQTKIKTN
jgi:sec-independent protein translocase protein TatC